VIARAGSQKKLAMSLDVVKGKVVSVMNLANALKTSGKAHGLVG